jgi:peptide/nickel transport system ATP-binding protein
MSLSVDGLRVYYRSLRGDVKAVDGATFEIADGEIMGLAGESGCGKTTLGKSLIRMDSRMRYVEGDVDLDGKQLPIWDDAKMNAFRFKEVSIIPQYALSALNPTRRVGQMTQELLASRRVPIDTVLPEFKRRLKLVGLADDVLDRFPIELSGGMKQRVVAELLVEFRDRGFVKSMIVITHDLSVLAQIADSILVMYAGKPAEKASTAAVVNAARHPYTKLLIGSLPEVGVTFEEQRLTGIKGKPPSLLEPPTGCRFRARCPLAFDKCAQEPPFAELESDHTAACWAA